jgi:hypothetical protein
MQHHRNAAYRRLFWQRDVLAAQGDIARRIGHPAGTLSLGRPGRQRGGGNEDYEPVTAHHISSFDR